MTVFLNLNQKLENQLYEKIWGGVMIQNLNNIIN